MTDAPYLFLVETLLLNLTQLCSSEALVPHEFLTQNET